MVETNTPTMSRPVMKRMRIFRILDSSFAMDSFDIARRGPVRVGVGVGFSVVAFDNVVVDGDDGNDVEWMTVVVVSDVGCGFSCPCCN